MAEVDSTKIVYAKKRATSDKILFQNRFLALIERDGYAFSREVRCDGAIISILPFRVKNNGLEFLARLEVCPAHGPYRDHYSITGGLEPNETVQEAAQKELWEEAGYQVGTDELISLGQVRPSKSADTIANLFAVDVTGKPQSTPSGDGTRFEANASVEWVDYEQGVQIKDPLFVTALARLLTQRKRNNGASRYQG
jgi:8-oxo-dGTP pyrophosphatase MutT (NUDIX family)